MDVAFNSKDLRTICENQELANDKFGLSIGAKLRDRLADLMAGTNIHDVVVGNPEPHQLNGHGDGYKIDLIDNYRIFITSGHVKTPLKENGEIDWNKVTRVKIVSIENIDNGK